MTDTAHFLAPLDELAVIRIGGEDASAFLHSQLSNDIAGIGGTDASLAAYCTPKGRMLASLIIWRESADAASPLLAMARADLTEPLIKRLRMFVLRAKVSFEATKLRVHGACVPAAAVQSASIAAGEEGTDACRPWQVRRDAGLAFISVPAAMGGPGRMLVVAPEDVAAGTLAHRLQLPLGVAADWQAGDIAAGLGWVERGNMELFIPQSLNYDIIGGVSFTKGCYPGQEVVARAHYRGTVKRRAFPALGYLPAGMVLKPGDDVYDALRPDVPAGRIINVAAAGANERALGGAPLQPTYVFVELALAEVGQADLRVVSAQGPAITLMALPYSLEAGD